MTSFTTALQRSAIFAWVMIGVSLAGLAWLVSDNKPPFKLLGYSATSAPPGQAIKIEATVERDTARRCSVTFSRHMFDSAGTRIDLVGQTLMTADAMEGLEKNAPGKLRVAFMVPLYATPGKARFITPLSYACNIWHALQPIETTMEMEVEILNPPPK